MNVSHHVRIPPVQSNSNGKVYFYPVGLGTEKHLGLGPVKWKFRTLATLMNELHDKKVK